MSKEEFEKLKKQALENNDSVFDAVEEVKEISKIAIFFPDSDEDSTEAPLVENK